MLNVFICEDQPEHLQYVSKCISNYIILNNLPMKILCSTASPDEVLKQLRTNRVSGIYFLDVDLKCKVNGLKLAEYIRRYDPRGFIVFITVDAKSQMLTFRYKVEAMDYIVKGDLDINDRICECLRNAYDKYTSKCTPLQNNYVFKLSKDKTISLDCSNILYFEVSPDTTHNVIVYTKDCRYEFRGNLTEIQQQLDNRFCRCHRAFIVNIKKIAVLDTALLKLHFENGCCIDISSKHIRDVKKLMATRFNVSYA